MRSNPMLKNMTDQLMSLMSSETNLLAGKDCDKKATLKRIKLVQRCFEALVEIQKMDEKDD